MFKAHRLLLALILLTSGPAMIAAPVKTASAATAAEINQDADQALQSLFRTNPVAEDLSKKARAVLIFPKIVKGGLIFGGSYGEGALRRGGSTVSYYNSVSASWGLQAGAQTYGYAVFLMNDKAVEYLTQSKGWEIGTGPTVVIVNEGASKNFSTTTLKDDAYAFIFGQQGLMAGINIEGSKISKIDR